MNKYNNINSILNMDDLFTVSAAFLSFSAGAKPKVYSELLGMKKKTCFCFFLFSKWASTTCGIHSVIKYKKLITVFLY